LGALKEVPAYDLAAVVLKEVILRADLEAGRVDEVILGQSYQSGEYVNIARMSLLAAGWPDTVPGVTVDRRCCTGLDVVCQAAMKVQCEAADIVVAGGVESMSSAEFYLPGEIKWGVGGKKGMPKGHGDLSVWGLPLYDRIQRARVMSQPEGRYGLMPAMMSWADAAAKEFEITREECDLWALASHQKACRAMDEGKFAEEIVPVAVPQQSGEPVRVVKDENPRRDASLGALSRLTPVLGGVCTAGNSSTENDGAAAVVVTHREMAERLGVQPLATLKSFAVAGVDPWRTYEAVPVAVEKALKRAALQIGQMDLIEVQEAFASQVLADLKEMGVGGESLNRVNVNGSGISLGHPIAATGTRVLVTLLHEMRRRNARYGLETICGGGGLGIAAVFERR
jgi:acetyl-CoA C-acetyltransferase